MTQSLAITCPINQNGQYQCNAATVALVLPVATVTGGSGTVNPLSYSATGVSFGADVNTQVTGTFPTSPLTHQVTASVTDSAGGSQTCTYSVVLTEDKNFSISGSGGVGSKMSFGFYWYCLDKQLR